MSYNHLVPGSTFATYLNLSALLFSFFLPLPTFKIKSKESELCLKLPAGRCSLVVLFVAPAVSNDVPSVASQNGWHHENGSY